MTGQEQGESTDDDGSRRERGASLRRDMVRGSLWTLVASIVLLPITFGVNLVLAHTLGPKGYGTVATYTAIFAVVGIVTDLGTKGATMQWLAEARALGHTQRETDLIRGCAGYHVFVEGPLAALAAIIVLRSTGVATCVAAAAALWATQLLITSTVVLVGTAQNSVAARLSLIVSIVSQATVVSLALSTRSPQITFAYPLLATAAGQLLFLTALTPAARRAVLRPTLRWEVPEGFRRYALSACAGTLVSNLVFGRSEIFVLRAHKLVTATGQFALSTGLAGQITVPMDSLMGPLLPTVAGLYAEAPERAVAALERSLRVTAALGALTASVVVPTLYVLLPAIYGHHYAPSVKAFGILAFVSCLQSVIVPVSAFALATRSAGAVLRTNLICLAADAGLAIGLIPSMGLYGAVVANVSSQILSLILLTRIVTRRMNVSWARTARAARAFGVGPIVGVLGIVAARLSHADSVLEAAVGGLTGLILFRFVTTAAPALRLSNADMSSIVSRAPAALQRVFGRLDRLVGLSRSAS